jgi:hypothetical protein
MLEWRDIPSCSLDLHVHIYYLQGSGRFLVLTLIHVRRVLRGVYRQQECLQARCCISQAPLAAARGAPAGLLEGMHMPPAGLHAGSQWRDLFDRVHAWQQARRLQGCMQAAGGELAEWVHACGELAERVACMA